MDETIVDIYLNNVEAKQKWQSFLTSLGINNFSNKEVSQIDFTIGIYDGDKLVATGSAAGNILKYIGVSNDGVASGSRFNKIVSELVSRLFRRQIFHLMVFTKIKYTDSFQHIGFKELAHSDTAAFLETGSPDVTDFLSNIPRVDQQEKRKIAGIVMNANPFTLGHRFLIEKAARENDFVYVFVVNTDASLFSTKERFKLVCAGTVDLKNVIVVDGGDYMVSYATFPAYFLPSANDEVKYQTTLDARIFRNVIAPPLNIRTRYVGSEPLSRTTSIYNDVLNTELPPRVALDVVDRSRTENNEYITATQVRKFIQADTLEKTQGLIPKTTLDFIQQNLHELQSRIQKGVNISGN